MKQLALAIALAAALSACGNKSETSSTTASTASPAPGSPAPPANAPTMPSTAATPAPSPPTSPPAPVTPATADTAGASTTAMGAASPGSGQDVYTKTCAVCHTPGVTGAPKPGDKADWGPRIAQGNQVLYDHAVKGYTGKKGVMPPKGGNTALADADVKAAVDFMVSQSK